MLKRVILGGYVQQERNLSQFGNAQVFGDVIASGEHVYDTN